MSEIRRTSARLHGSVRDAIARGDRDFDAIAREVLAFQAAHVAPVARLVTMRGADPTTTPLDEIPGVPCDVFRLRRVAAHDSTDDVRVFRTSGTTLGLRGQHFFRDTSTYEAAAIAFGADSLWKDLRPSRVLAIAPSSVEVPDSSLGFMIDLFARHLALPIAHYVSTDRGLDPIALARAAAEARADGRPVLFLGTAFGFVHALDAEPRIDLRLPAGSRAMLTGGFKGRSREIAESELRALLVDRLAIAPADVMGEYGMTELSSQLWQVRSAALEGRVRYAWPRWMKVIPVHPETLVPVASGEIGIAKILDTANVDSAMVIQTSDLVRLDDEGLELLGRAPGATPRGCSLAIEEITGG